MSERYNAENEHGATPFHLVSRGEYNSQEHGLAIAQLLLGRGADPNARQKNGFIPLHWAAYKGRLEIAQLLLDHGANLKAENEHGATPLHLVSQGDYNSEELGVGIAQLLLGHGADPNARQKNNRIPLHWAAYKGRLEIARLLLDHGANPIAEEDDGATPLHEVSRGEYSSQELGVGIARLLLERGADPNARQKNGFIPLHWAAYKGRLKIAQLLLGHNPNPNAEIVWGEKPLNKVSQDEYSSQEHGVAIARPLREHGMDVDARCKVHATALHYAALAGNSDIVQLLLEHGADPNAENDHGRTPLHSLSRGKDKSHDRIGIARLLLESGAGVNAKEKNSWTLLHSAVFNMKLEIVQVLLFPSFIKNPFMFCDHRYCLTMVQMQMRRTMRARPHYT